MRVVVIGPNLRDQSKGSFHVHRSGCADTRKAEYRAHADDLTHPWDAESRLDVVLDLYPPDDFSYDPTDPDELAGYHSDIHFFPCTSELPEVTP